MSARRRILPLAGLTLLGLAALAVGVAVAQPESVVEQTAGTGPAGYTQPAADVIARGQYLATMGDCIGCHSAPGGPRFPAGGKFFAGGRIMEMPFGALSTPNITPDTRTGIGTWTDAQFLELMRNGVTPAGTHLYPAMPYAWYHTLTDADLLAIKAYLFSLPPVHAPRLANHVWFPFSIRPAIALWDAAFVPSGQFRPDPKLTDEQNRGSWIVNGLEHCGMCHNNRNFLGNSDIALRLQGGPISHWYAPDLHSDKETGLGRFTDADLYSFFKEGHSPAMGVVAGPMAEVIDYSTKHLPDTDIRAVIAYLRTLPQDPAYVPRKPRAGSARFEAGRMTYLSHCASCHQVDGRGIPGVIPALDGNGMVRAFGPQSVIGVVLGGLEARGPYALMPGVGAGMTDQEIADAVNYVRQAWSNGAPANADAFLVSVLRPDADKRTVLNGGRPCPPLADPAVQRLLADQSDGIAALLQKASPSTLLQTADAIVARAKQAAPDLARNDLVNGMMLAYCPVAQADTSLRPEQRLWQMLRLAERLYVQSSTGGAY